MLYWKFGGMCMSPKDARAAATRTCSRAAATAGHSRLRGRDAAVAGEIDPAEARRHREALTPGGLACACARAATEEVDRAAATCAGGESNGVPEKSAEL